MLDTQKKEKVRTNVYVGRASKEKAQRVLKKYGLSLSEAVNLFFAVIAESGKLPFELRIPNRVTRKVMEEIVAGKNIEGISPEELIREAQKTQAVR
jgi:DNA-damage-inducible protein J